jgi:hypothetical protein
MFHEMFKELRLSNDLVVPKRSEREHHGVRSLRLY